MKTYIDFESRSRAEIWECGAWVYSQDESTEVLCLAYAIGDGEVHILTKEDLELGVVPQDLIDEINKGTLISSFNALFEQCIWINIMVPKYGFPRIPIRQFRCTMAKALARSLPRSLKEVGKVLNADNQKDEAGHRIMMKLCKPGRDGNWHEDPEDLQKLYDYCVSDVEAERAIDKMLPDLNANEQIIWMLDQRINTRGIYVDTQAVRQAINFSEVHASNLNHVVEEVSGGALDGVTRRMAVLQWCKEKGVDIQGYTKSDVTHTLTADLPAEVRTVLETKLQLGKTSVQKYRALERSTSEDERIRDLLIYHGAATGRWAGKLVQLQNLPKGNVEDTDQAVEILKNSETLEDFQAFYPDVMGTLSSCIRGMIISSPGHDLLVADYSAIEARVVMWLANDEYGLKQFREGIDLYVDMARVIYNKETISKQERQLGKAAVLGCGYGMGHAKFLATCTSWGIPVTELVAKKAVETYRSVYGSVRNSWYEQERTAITCIRDQKNYNCGPIRWELDCDVLLCRLPSGRTICYNSPTLEYVETSWGEKKLALHYMGLVKVQGQTTTKWGRMPTYGGKIIENITQAVARDILAYAMLRCEQAGYSVAFSVHDEIVSEVPENFGTVEEFQRIICTLPKWATGLPIDAEGWRGKRYKK